MVKKISFIIISFFIFILIQTTIVQYIRINNYLPDFIFIFLIFLSLFYDEMVSMILAFVIGIIVDTLAFNIVVLSSLFFTMIAYIIGKLKIKFVSENIPIQITYTFFGFLFYSIILKMFSGPEITLILRQEVVDVLITAFYTSLFAPIIIFLLLKIKKVIFAEIRTYEV